MIHFLDEYFENKDLHIVAFSEDYKMLVGYEILTNKMLYVYETNDNVFEADLLSHCNDEFTKWFNELFKLLNYSVQIFEDANNYYEVIVK